MYKKLVFAVCLLMTVFALPAQEARYEVKSAIIQKTMEMMGQQMENIQYIDDYGSKETIVMKMTIPGAGSSIEVRTINKGDTIISINMTNKTGQRTVLPEKPVNFRKITPEIKEKYELKEEGQEQIAGKMCNKYSMVVTQMGVKASSTVWIWKGITLKSVTSVSGMTVTELTTGILENVAPSAEFFTIPDGVTIQ
ncbi:MAG: hypothetical protein LBE79_01765 [Tannerella sp.]|jgi:hypothetical protein|nr:hypothetical protein [Tannerella sp.]